MTARSAWSRQGSVLVALGLVSVAGYIWLLAVVGGLGEGTPTYVERLLPGGHGLVQTSYPTLVNPSAQEVARRHLQAAPRFTLAITVLFLVYAAAIWAVRAAGGRWSRHLIVVFAALFQALALLAPHMLSSDVYAYTFYGRILAVYGRSPYIETPAAFPDDPYRALIFWQDAPSFYGPLWTLLSGALAALAGAEPALASLLFRGVEALAALAGTVLVGAILDRTAPTRVALGMVLFGWNPLLVVEAGLGGHNDVLMAALVVAALLAVVRERLLLGVALLTLAGLVKVVALALLPLLGLFALRRLPTLTSRLALTGRALGVVLGVGALIVAPTWAGSATLAVGVLGVGESRYTNGLGELALRELRIAFGEDTEDTLTPLLFTPWWVATEGRTPLRSARGDDTPVLRQLDAGAPLLVVSPQYGRWVRVYDPSSRWIGIVRLNAVGQLPARPAAFDADADILTRERGPTGSPALQRANLIVRVVGWGAAGLIWLAALALGTRSWPGLLRGTIGFFLALLYLVSAWFWPWYVVWALAPAALLPSNLLRTWAVTLSWGSLLLYPSLGFGQTAQSDLYTYRSLAMFGLPLALVAGMGVYRLVMFTAAGQTPAAGTTALGVLADGGVAAVSSPSPAPGLGRSIPGPPSISGSHG